MTEPVRAELRRSSGFAGRSLHVVMDSRTLPADQARQLVQLVRSLDLTSIGAMIMAPCTADLLRYDLSVQCGGRHWRGTVAEPTVPAELRPLIQFLTEAAMVRR
ncbi:protealysin inhibitor emfourin [Actinoplanes sp. DH11]|uniref:protealysin inhibitor emfourin n=1 Tax=Actinoplanes sp. DH11 TaxID=2857011 RepID=UPI001E58B23F|nr:protealysin inhibitor emfourin [Actinoplanes sp. DH11]